MGIVLSIYINGVRIDEYYNSEEDFDSSRNRFGDEKCESIDVSSAAFDTKPPCNTV